MKEEALKLADEALQTMSKKPNKKWTDEEIILCQQADMIRRLVEELDKQGEPVAWVFPMVLHPSKKGFSEVKPDDKYKPVPLYTAPQPKPLSDEEILKLWWGDKSQQFTNDQLRVMFARRIEERHGVK